MIEIKDYSLAIDDKKLTLKSLAYLGQKEGMANLVYMSLSDFRNQVEDPDLVWFFDGPGSTGTGYLIWTDERDKEGIIAAVVVHEYSDEEMKEINERIYQFRNYNWGYVSGGKFKRYSD